MRKLTGYIGAMIIVFALMGSILAGYALNINGTTAVMNEYEKVTDVSGLYSHSQEPSYIDYNPASNYIGYSSMVIAYTNTPTNPSGAGMGYMTMKKITDNCTIEITNDKKIIINGVENSTISTGGSYWRDVFYSTNVRVSANDTNSYYYLTDCYNGWRELQINSITLNINNGNITVSALDLSNNAFNFTMGYDEILTYWPHNDFDYYNNRTLGQYTGAIPSYLTDEQPIYSYGNDNGDFITTVNNTAHSYYTGNDYTIQLFTTSVISGNISYSSNINYNGSYHVYYPRYIYTTSLGIDYVESNRVNNYPVPNSSSSISSTSTQTINISNLTSITNYMPASNQYNITMYEGANVGKYNNGSQDIVVSNANYYMPASTLGSGNTQLGLLNYKLSDILTAGATIPANTKQIRIDLDSNNSIAYNRNLNVTNYIDYCDLNIPTLNNGVFVTNNAYSNVFGNYTLKVNNGFGVKDYAIYDINDNIVSIYSYNGVKKSTLTPDNCYIASTNLNGYNSNNMILTYTAEQRTGSNNNTTWQSESYYYGGTIVQNYGYTNSNNFTTNIKLTYYISQTTDIKYFDITKGYSIKDTNTINTVWDNNYDNGKIQVLFRAPNTPGTYHNDIIIGDNSISIDYNPNKYLVSLNGADPVDIGTWRNIILDIDLINGELSAIPVRTFNNFTNVELDNTNIFIGDLINPAPTNIIEWVPTTNSLMFNIYSTSVFMNTYGVVMVNPTLNITSYFTDLNNFYQLKIYNISIYGQSMTINGVTGTVTGNNITFNNETVQIKDMSITYADGHAYVSDSHVTIDLGEITDNTVSMAGSWYFITDLMRGYTTHKMIYEWDWEDFILDNVQFCVIYIGLALIGLLIARHYCTLTITDYAIFLVSIVIALTIQVIA